MLKVASGSMNAFDSILTNHLLQSIICLFFIVSTQSILYQSNNFVMLFTYSSSNISHFEQHLSSTKKRIYSCNESLTSTLIMKRSCSHSLRASSKQINNSLTSSTMRNVTLNSSILLKGSSVDVTLFTTSKSLQMIFSATKTSSYSTFIMHCLIFHLCMCFSMISIKLTQLVNCPLMMTPLFDTLIVSDTLSFSSSLFDPHFFSSYIQMRSSNNNCS